jgi:hypothetical protein
MLMVQQLLALSLPFTHHSQIEIILNFFIGFHESGFYHDSLPDIARRYFFAVGKFTFDVLTSIPLSYIDLYFSKVPRRRSFLVSVNTHYSAKIEPAHILVRASENALHS